jgi:hypothetical protein
VARPTDLRRGSEQRPRLADIAVRLAEVHAVGAKPLGQSHAIVDYEGNIRVRANALQRLGETRQLMLVDVLDAKLKGRRNAGLESGAQPVRESIANVLRADQVKLRRPRAWRSRELNRKEVSFIHSQAGTLATEAW